MFLLDDILLSPVKGLLWVFKEIQAAAMAAQTEEKDDITARLSELYMELETGRITEAQFDEREKALLDRLDTLDERDATLSAEEGDGSADAKDEDDEDDEDDEADEEDEAEGEEG